MILRRALPLAFLAVSPAFCADVLVYRCTNSAGAVSLQDTPCAAGEHEELRRLRAPIERAPAMAPAQATNAASEPGPSTAGIAPRVPVRDPAPLFVCMRHDGVEYESTTGIPERRWVPLWALDADPRTRGGALDPSTIGRTSPLRRTARDGVPMISISGAALGTWVEDRCTALSPIQICDRRRATLADYGRRIFNAGQSDADRLRAEETSLRRQVREECGR